MKNSSTTSSFVLSDWITYYAERLRVVLDDPTLSSTEQLNWTSEFVPDLEALAPETPHAAEARELARAQHAFIFHDGPDPNENSQT